MNSYETIKSVMNCIGFSDNLNIDINNNDYVSISPLMIFVDNNINKKSKFMIPLNVLLGIDNDYKYVLPCDILLEDNCPLGLFCQHKTNPIKCPFNHHDIKSENNILCKGTLLPVLLCRYERPWKLSNGKPVVCMNPNCWYNHFKGRVNRIKNNIYYDSQNKK